MAFADRLRLAQVADVARRNAHQGQPRGVDHAPAAGHAALAAAGIDPGAVRFSIGLEDAEDLHRRRDALALGVAEPRDQPGRPTGDADRQYGRR